MLVRVGPEVQALLRALGRRCAWCPRRPRPRRGRRPCEAPGSGHPFRAGTRDLSANASAIRCSTSARAYFRARTRRPRRANGLPSRRRRPVRRSRGIASSEVLQSGRAPDCCQRTGRHGVRVLARDCYGAYAMSILPFEGHAGLRGTSSPRGHHMRRHGHHWALRSDVRPRSSASRSSAFAGLDGRRDRRLARRPGLLGRQRRAAGFLEVIRRIEAGETGGVIVARIDRFARSAPDGGAMVRRISRQRIFASAQERIDPTTGFGKAMLNIMFVMAELQLDQLKSGWKAAKGRAIKRGAHIGPTPFGYRASASRPGRLRDADAGSVDRTGGDQALPPSGLRRGVCELGAVHGRDRAARATGAVDDVARSGTCSRTASSSARSAYGAADRRCETRARTRR